MNIYFYDAFFLAIQWIQKTVHRNDKKIFTLQLYESVPVPFFSYKIVSKKGT